MADYSLSPRLMSRAANNTEDGFGRTKTQVTGWLLADSWKLQELPSPETAWAVIAEDEQGKKVVIGQPNQKPDLLVLQAAIDILNDLRTRVANFDDREDLLWEIRF